MRDNIREPSLVNVRSNDGTINENACSVPTIFGRVREQ
jgi:hypothetical protein